MRIFAYYFNDMTGILIIYNNDRSISRLAKQSNDIKTITKILKERKDWYRAHYFPLHAYKDSFIIHSYGIGLTVQRLPCAT